VASQVVRSFALTKPVSIFSFPMGISLKNYLYKKAAFGEQACFSG
jgi:hypothetical protein